MNNLLFKATMLLVALIATSAHNAAWADEVTVGDISNTGCADKTRSASVMGRPTLKLTRFDGGLYGELNNCKVNCAYGDVNVICQENGQNLSIVVDENTGEDLTTCVCHINIYFTIFNALQDEYQLTVRGRDAGMVSFKEHSVVIIDLETLEQAHEEGFDYPITVEYFDPPYEITSFIKPDQDLSQKLDIYNDGKYLMCFIYNNYVLPCEYTYLDAQAGLDQDSTLVINILTDGIPGKDCKRIAHLSFYIANILKETYRMRLNHTILYKGEDEQERSCTVCLYEGELTIPQYGNLMSIPITDNNDYEALISSMATQQLTDADSAAPIYDLQGRRVGVNLQSPTGKPQRRGLYIRDGKKVVIK